MKPFKVEREVRHKLRPWKFSCGKSILETTQSNLATGYQMSKTRQDKVPGNFIKRKRTQDECGP